MTDQSTGDQGTNRHSVPVIERMMEILTYLEKQSGGASITELTERIAQPRTTVYRILKTLEQYDVVRREGTRVYKLGPRLLTLASHVAADAVEVDLPELAQPIITRLSEETGEGVKLSVPDGRTILVIAVAQSRREYALTVARGQHIPLHVGAAGKLIFAHFSPEERERLLSEPLPRFTDLTVTDPGILRRELDEIREQGWSHDQGEHIANIEAFAAPIYNSANDLVAAISVPFLGSASADRRELIRTATLAAAREVSEGLKARQGQTSSQAPVSAER